jgi:hypothetical protein
MDKTTWEITLMVTLFCLFCWIDAMFYVRSKFPNRCKWYFTLVPGGGVWAYFKFRTNK